MRTQQIASRPLPPFFDEQENMRGRGGQIDWTRVAADGSYNQGKFTVTVTEPVAVGAETATVAALAHPLKAGSVLDFGDYEPSTVVIAAAGEAIGQTVLSVDALTAALPAGAVLDFGAGENVVVLASAAAAGATTITITEALTIALEDNDEADFPGGSQNIRLTADAAAGATTLAIEPAPMAIADNDTAQGDYTGTDDFRIIPSGTVMARTTAGLLIPRAVADAETASEILASDAIERSDVDSMTGYGTYVSGLIFENMMPDADGSGDIVAGWKTELATAGCSFIFHDFVDSRLT
jgi:hypothetical protein